MGESRIHGVVAVKFCRGFCENEGDKEEFREHEDKRQDESARIKRLVRSKPKQCYVNAFRVVLQVPEYAEADYVEGLAVIGRRWLSSTAGSRRTG